MQADDLDNWLAAVSAAASSHEHGADSEQAEQLLQEHRLVCTELANYHEPVAALQASAQGLVEGNNFKAHEVEQRQQELDAKHAQLLQLTSTRRQALEESVKLHQFEMQCAALESWMAERESIARSCELGADVLETESLIKRHDDFGKYLTANGSRLEALQTIAIQREEESHSNAEQFLATVVALRCRWAALEQSSANRGALLLERREVVSFLQEVCDTSEWIAQKRSTLGCDELGDSVGAAASLLRRHGELQTEMLAVRSKVLALRSECGRIGESQPVEAAELLLKQADLDGELAQAETIAASRERALLYSDELQRFLEPAAELLLWLGDETARIEAAESGGDAAATEVLTLQHTTRKAEIEVCRCC